MRQPVRRRHSDQPGSCDIRRSGQGRRRRDDGGLRARRRLRGCGGGPLGRTKLMLPLMEANPVTAEILDTLPDATDPFALSLNENPFPPLPAVRSALIRSIDVANRYPEFLPERLRRLIAGHIGVRDDQVVLGAGASGVVMQVLHAVTRPGDRIEFSEPTFDGYPIFTRMARLTAASVPLDERGHHDLEAMAEAAAGASVVALCRPHNPTGTLEPVAVVQRFLRRGAAPTIRPLSRGPIAIVAPPHRP